MTLGDILIGLGMALGLGLTAWFFVAAQWNARRNHEALRWLREGLPLLSDKTGMNWMGTTGCLLTMNAAKTPFKSAEILTLMEPRDVVPLWLLSHLQGRRDIMIMRGPLRRHTRVEFDLLDTKSWSGKQVLRRGIPKEWSQSTLPDGMLLASEGPDATMAAQQIKARLGRLAPYVRRVSVRRTVPHIEVHLLAPWQSGLSATDVINAFKELGDMLLPKD